MTTRPASLDGLLGYVADNLPPESESIALAAFVDTMLTDPPATEQDVHAMARLLFAQHTRELAAMVRAEYPGPDLDRTVRVAAGALERYATRLDGQNPTP